MVCNAHVAPTPYLFDAMHTTTIPAQHMNTVWCLINNISVVNLPCTIRNLQLAALERAFYMDTDRIEARQWIHLCVFCAYKSCSTQHAQRTRPMYTSKMRFDCVSGAFVCSSCNIPSILDINILGRVVRIGDVPFTLSCCCASIVEYRGAGSEFETACGQHCASAAVSRFKSSSRAPPPRVTRLRCAICAQHGAVQTIQVLDVPTRSMQSLSFCCRHRIPDHLQSTIYDTRELMAVISPRMRTQTRGSKNK